VTATPTPIELARLRREGDPRPGPPRRTLYDLSADWADAVNTLMDLDPEDAERWEIFSSSLDELQPQIEAKCEAIACLVRELELLARAQKAEAQRIEERAQANQARAQRLRAYVVEQLRGGGLDRVDTTRFTLTVRPSPESVEVHDLDLLPEEFVVTRSTRVPDRELIRRHYRATGEIPPGVTITRGDHLDIR
jgi:Siphovirus Gp157